ncbi:MAG: hypothetical protein LBR16_03335 [Treponema sp.]|nr:hypothetical protein [Treponema sp.]
MAGAVDSIAQGRLGMETEGEASKGVAVFAKGIAAAAELYTEVIASKDPELMILAEYTYMSEELKHAEAGESGAEASAAAAIQSFDDALLVLKTVENPAVYEGAEQAFPHYGQWRCKGFPRDAFHVACIAHKTRIKNGLSRFGVNRRDRTLAELRIAMLNAAQDGYLEKQKKALEWGGPSR